MWSFPFFIPLCVTISKLSMSKLEELYQSIETLKKLGVQINDEQLKSLDSFEEDLIKNEVLPALSQDIAPRLNPIKRDLVLVVEYHPGQPISVALSRKVKIRDFVGAKALTPVSVPVSDPSKPAAGRDNSGPSKHIENFTKGLKVSFPDGTVIWRKSAIETYIATIKHVGYEKVSALKINHGGYNAVSRTKRPTEPGRIWQHESDGWYIYSNISNRQKIDDLKLISEKLGLRLQIEEKKPTQK